MNSLDYQIVDLDADISTRNRFHVIPTMETIDLTKAMYRLFEVIDSETGECVFATYDYDTAIFYLEWVQSVVGLSTFAGSLS